MSNRVRDLATDIFLNQILRVQWHTIRGKKGIETVKDAKGRKMNWVARLSWEAASTFYAMEDEYEMERLDV